MSNQLAKKRFNYLLGLDKSMGNKKYKNFEDWLKYKHMDEEPQVLDDDLPDAFEAWISELDVAEVLEYVKEYEQELANKE